MKAFAMRSFVRLATTATVLALVGCGGPPAPPAELVNARAELARAKSGTAQQLDPASVHEAELALQRAERAFEDKPDEPETLDLAAIAQLKAAAAQAQANAIASTQKKDQAQREFTNLQSDRLQAAEGNLNRTREQLERASQETQAERQKRMEAEAKLKDAMMTLSKIAQVKEEDRGTVITFQGEVLFKTGKADLLPAAMIKLDQVVDSLRGQERHLVVVGHTDNQGGNSKANQELSERRANAVRDYLVAKGIPADLIRSEGKGPTVPIADNTSVEGRAQNRRVEIVVQPKGAR
jgi:outer membrane protein OmpA-like peptidoglycan-associated protein